MRRSAPIALAGLLAACSPPDREPFARSFSVEDGWLRAPDGRVAVLRGANVANSHKHPPHLGFHDAEDFARMRQEWGWEAVRFLVTWAALEPTDGAIDGEYLDAVAERIALAGEAGLLVVVDMHQDVYGPGFGGDGMPLWTCDAARYEAFVPRDPWFLGYLDENVQACFDGFWTDEALQGRFVDAWAAVSARLADEPAVIGFDPLNEPHWGSGSLATIEGERWPSLVERVVEGVRADNPEWVAFVEPLASRNLGIPTEMPPFAFADAVYAPHSYDRTAESGGGFDADRRQAVLDHVAAVQAEAEHLGGALWIGEYGGRATHPGIAEYMDAEIDGFDAAMAGAAYWSYDADSGYGLLDADGVPKEALLDAVLRPTPARIAGEPLGWEWADGRFTLSWIAAGPALPTEVRFAPRTFPGGVVASCDGCTAEVGPGVVRARAGFGEEVRLVLSAP